jgi:hypothetical protein
MIEEFGPAHAFSGLNIHERKKVQLSFSMLSLYDIEYYYISYGNTGTLMRQIFIVKNPPPKIPVRSVQNKVSRDLSPSWRRVIQDYIENLMRFLILLFFITRIVFGMLMLDADLFVSEI